MKAQLREIFVLFTLASLVVCQPSHLPEHRPALEAPQTDCGRQAKTLYLMAYATHEKQDSTRALLAQCREALPALRARLSP